ncbi:hypothetical protein C1I98_04755 [Spongiactinospora gelatinilytica]|uniref:Integral membrane protein n=1 Tax=Spongiactinospora gelatinilytica TaxID=2666298 RepID=A0A2W2HWB7_9ACTN|nr:hypothetical protein [Spongiactinospora gelatinilytica]PZG54148.1 hypothetical protein C1I98_04755 [Spongiactinospora gelatinilytica]
MAAITAPGTRAPLLRRVLRADAVLTGGFAVLLAVAAALLAGLTGLPEPLLRWAGIGLLPVTAFITFLAIRPTPPRAAVWTLIAVNALWTVDSVALLFTGWIDPNPLGVAFVVAQAVLVGIFAELQYLGLRRS